MKKYFKTIIIAFLVSISLSSQAQIKFNNKGNNIRDFKNKTTMVVLNSHNSMLDLLLKNAIKKNWTISKYEFCSQEDFRKLASDTSYYFLVKYNKSTASKSGSVLQYLTLVKGGSRKGLFYNESKEISQNLNNMATIISLPMQDDADESGDIYNFLPSYIKIIQKHVNSILDNKIVAFAGMMMYSTNFEDEPNRVIFFNKKDLGLNDIDLKNDMKLFKGKAQIVDQKTIENVIKEKKNNVLVSLNVSPLNPQYGDENYNMLINPLEGTLVYYKKTKISRRAGKGFHHLELKWLSAFYK
ncbi:MAG: hypothetical protein WCS34_00900 [Bacteroidales bacterium]